MSEPTRYLEAWESFWRDAPVGEGSVFWDAGAEFTAERHLRLFEPHFDPALALLDLGCGNGTQTRFLARRYRRVVGIDLSAAAIEHAIAEDTERSADFRRVDAAVSEEMAALREEFGDLNIYMRGVIHQCDPADRERIVKNIAVLLGKRGRLFAVEPGDVAKPVFMNLMERPEGPPAKLQSIFAHGITPGEMDDSEVPVLLDRAGLTVLARGEMPAFMTEAGADGSRIQIPTNWLVIAATR